MENCIGADVDDNVTTGNTGGILVFNMPDLPQPGHTTRVFNNRIVANNHDNFGRAGTAVAAVPAGSGVVIMSNDDVEIFGNELADNRTATVLIASHYSAGYDSTYKPSQKFEPSQGLIFIHVNRFSVGGHTTPVLD